MKSEGWNRLSDKFNPFVRLGANKLLRNGLTALVSLLAIMTVVSSTRAANCDPAPTNLVSWWPAEGTANDSVGNNNGTLQNGAGFAPGIVGQAFTFNGTNQWVDVTNSPALNPTNSFTIEGW